MKWTLVSLHVCNDTEGTFKNRYLRHRLLECIDKCLVRSYRAKPVLHQWVVHLKSGHILQSDE
jgi:hypothetical protein